MGLSRSVAEFAQELEGELEGEDLVYVAGTQSRVPIDASARVIRAPEGIIDFQPDEMTVVCGAGTLVNDLSDFLAMSGQYVNLPLSRSGGTVGGAIAMGQSGLLRLGRGPTRDVLLMAQVIGSDGREFTAGGPTVKNVTGFDLCRLLVGSHGAFGALAVVTLRTRPLPMHTQWFTGKVTNQEQAEAVLHRVHRPSAVLWDGLVVNMCLEGHPDDVAESIRNLSTVVEFSHSVIPDLSRFHHRRSLPPSVASDEAERRPGEVVVELGVGIVHDTNPTPTRRLSAESSVIVDRLLAEFNPRRRLNRHALDYIR